MFQDDPNAHMSDGDVAWGVYDGCIPVGFGVVRIDGDCGYLSLAGVIPSYRGRGIQRAIIIARLRYLKRRGVVVAKTHTRSNNVASMRSLVACGFMPAGYSFENEAGFIDWERTLK